MSEPEETMRELIALLEGLYMDDKPRIRAIKRAAKYVVERNEVVPENTRRMAEQIDP